MKRKLSTLTWISLVALAICVFSALFCYFLVIDNTPNANLQIPQIALLPPGAQQDLYKERITNTNTQPFLNTMLYGKPTSYKYHPVDSVTIKGSTVVIAYGAQKKLIKIISNEDPHANVEKRLFILGTDKYGRDILSRIVIGLRVSLLVGLFSVMISIVVGVTMGLLSGYYGGWVDRVIMTFINVNWSIPTLLLAFAILLVMDRGLLAIFLAIGLTLWVDLARIIRGQVMEIREKNFVLAAMTMGISGSRIMLRHILPNLLGTILVIASINFATAILVEAGLSYLGLGVQPPIPSLGNMLKENYGYATSGYIILAIAPALSILVLVLSFNLLGSGLRDYYDIRR